MKHELSKLIRIVKNDSFLCDFFLQRIDYLTYLETFDRLFDIPKEKKNPEYRRLGTVITMIFIIKFIHLCFVQNFIRLSGLI